MMNSTMLAPDYQDQPDRPSLEPAAQPSYPPLIIERFLRDRDGVWRQIEHEHGLTRLIRHMLSSSAVSLACYGLVIGMSQSWLQALASAVKLPILFLLTLLICLPTLYLFNLLFGGRLTVRQVLALALSTITITSALTLAFAPITLFFMITARGYTFFVLLNTFILAITGAAGLHFLVKGTRAINKLAAPTSPLPLPGDTAPTEPAPAPAANMGLIWGWLVLYGFVGTQLAWTLRPFFGMPGEPFVLFRSIEGSFYESIITIITSLLF